MLSSPSCGPSRALAICVAAFLAAGFASAFAPVRHIHSRPFATRLASSEDYDDDDDDMSEFEGKMLVERKFYKLTYASQVAVPNALMIEERLQYLPDMEVPGVIKPYGERQWILRKGTEGEEITEELYRITIGDNRFNGPLTIATALFIASNPQVVQGDLLEIAAGPGGSLSTLLGCIGATAVKCQIEGTNFNVDESQTGMLPTSISGDSSILTSKLNQLTLTDEREDRLELIKNSVKITGVPADKVTVQEFNWQSVFRERQITGSPTGREYQLVIGSDVDFMYPAARALSKVVAHTLRPSQIGDSPSRSEEPKPSFGGIGMERTVPTARVRDSNGGFTYDAVTPPTFLNVCSGSEPDLHFLRNFLEKGFRMGVKKCYLELETRVSQYAVVDIDAPDSILDAMEMRISTVDEAEFEGTLAVHSPEYIGTGWGEMFFPLENGSYEGGGRVASIEPETDAV